MICSDDVSLYWVENSIFVSKPFDRLEELVDLILRLPIRGQESLQRSEAVILSGMGCPSVLAAA